MHHTPAGWGRERAQNFSTSSPSFQSVIQASWARFSLPHNSQLISLLLSCFSSSPNQLSASSTAFGKELHDFTACCMNTHRSLRTPSPLSHGAFSSHFPSPQPLSRRPWTIPQHHPAQHSAKHQPGHRLSPLFTKQSMRHSAEPKSVRP